MEPEVDIRNVEAAKPFRLGGKEYGKGDSVDVTGLPDHKISQLLNQRFIRPKSTDT